jgi:hypothetical protein
MYPLSLVFTPVAARLKLSFAVEYLRRDQSNLSPAQYLKKLKQLELEFADLLALSSSELKEEIYFAWRLGVHVH